MFDIFLALLLGVFCGIITGILPSIHINTVAFFVGLASIPVNPFLLVVFLCSLSISHNFFDFIPSIVFGAGEEGSALSGFIGNRLFLEGNGVIALKLVGFGCVFGCVIFLFLLPLFYFFLPILFTLLSDFSWVLLLGVELHLVLRDKSLHALVVLLLSGVLGLIVLNSGLRFPLLSLFSGLFGLGVVFENLRVGRVEAQRVIYGVPLDRKSAFRGAFKGVFSSIVLSLVPAIGPSQACVLVYSGGEEFLISLGAINIADVLISLLTLFLFGRARSGVLVEVDKFFSFDFDSLCVIFLVCFISAVVSFFVFLRLGKFLIMKIPELNYRRIVFCVVIFIVVVNFLFNGFAGVLVCFIGGLISRHAIKMGIMKSHCMGVLIIPTIIHYL